MRRPFVAGNWKMNLDRAKAVSLARAVATGAGRRADVELAVCPPHVYLCAVGEVVAGSPVALGAQNMYHEPSGAFTGETSAAMLLDVGCRYVILGHSERRHLMGETDAAINRKLQAALAAGLTPILCVGELLNEREAGRTADVIRTQCEGSLAGVDGEQMGKIVIAYEPVWAIGTGRNATPEQAQEVHADLRKLLAARYNAAVAGGVRILYGGSVKAANAAALLGQADVDGALVGGASLQAEEFLAIAAGAPQAV
ncbi:MAG: triose-phosphate isomerase [Pirellulales bacterium]|nr:triose-phosphate isomerase [Pirellulales bacterium]